LQYPPKRSFVAGIFPEVKYFLRRGLGLDRDRSAAPGGLVEQNRRRVPRFPFSAFAELVEEASGAKSRARVTELSLCGCYIETVNPSPEGTIFSVKIFTDVEYFESRATVAYAHPNSGMGMTFRDVRPHFLPVLKGWLLSALQNARQEEQPT
jgi:hypothetical protein